MDHRNWYLVKIDRVDQGARGFGPVVTSVLADGFQDLRRVLKDEIFEEGEYCTGYCLMGTIRDYNARHYENGEPFGVALSEKFGMFTYAELLRGILGFTDCYVSWK